MIGVEFTVLNTRARTHHLYISKSDGLGIVHAVFMRQVAFQWNGNDFHIVVRMCAKAHSTGNNVVIQYTQYAKLNTIGIIIPRKAEGMPGF